MSTLYFFFGEILSPTTERVIDVECTYAVGDAGPLTRMGAQATLSSVRDRDGSEYLPLLDPDTIGNLEREALANWEAEMECNKYGCEEI